MFYEKRNNEKKLEILQDEIRKAQEKCDDYTKRYLEILDKEVENYINKLDKNEMETSDGGALGLRRAIIEYDDIAEIDSLYDAAADVDRYYSKECKTWK